MIDQYSNFDWCLETYNASKPFIHNYRTAVDVGCRRGEYTISLLIDFKKIYAFDYRPSMTIESKKLIYHQIALGDKDIKVKANAGVIVEDGKLVVQQKKLDDYHLLDVDYIKVDVEGHELKVLKGAINTIERCNPLIVIEENGSQELWKKGIKNDALNYLLSIGYKVVKKMKLPNPLDIILTR